MRKHPHNNILMPMLSWNVYARYSPRIARLVGYISESVSESPKWTVIIRNMADTRRTLHQLLKGKQLYSSLCGVCTEVLHDLTAVLKKSAARGETAKITITAPPSTEEFCEQRRRKRVNNPTTFTTTDNDLQLQSKSEVPTRNFFSPPRSI
jgi:hypothetical protein